MKTHDHAAQLAHWLAVTLYQVDYTEGTCGVTEMVGAVLDSRVIEKSRAAIAAWKEHVETTKRKK